MRREKIPKKAAWRDFFFHAAEKTKVISDVNVCERVSAWPHSLPASVVALSMCESGGSVKADVMRWFGVGGFHSVAC